MPTSTQWEDLDTIGTVGSSSDPMTRPAGAEPTGGLTSGYTRDVLGSRSSSETSSEISDQASGVIGWIKANPIKTGLYALGAFLLGRRVL